MVVNFLKKKSSVRKKNFLLCLSSTLGFEGEFSSHPDDPGGRTNYGITEEVYHSWLFIRGETRKDVRFITRSEIEQIYYANYWGPARCGELPLPLAMVLFDYAVHSGVHRAIRDLQMVVSSLAGKSGLIIDGVIGIKTRKALMTYLRNSSERPEVLLLNRGPHKRLKGYRARVCITARALCRRRNEFLKSLDHYTVFGNGWMNRVKILNEMSDNLCMDSPEKDLLPPEGEELTPAREMKPLKQADMTKTTPIATAGFMGVVETLRNIIPEIGHGYNSMMKTFVNPGFYFTLFVIMITVVAVVIFYTYGSTRTRIQEYD